MKSINNLFDINRVIDAAETAQQKFVSYMPESMRDHASQFVTAGAEFTRSAFATTERMGKIVKTSLEEATQRVKDRFAA